jgi:hypothetical protein
MMSQATRSPDEPAGIIALPRYLSNRPENPDEVHESSMIAASAATARGLACPLSHRASKQGGPIMSKPKSPTPQTAFDVAVHQGYQFTQQGRFTRVRLLISLADATREWVGWYMFTEGLVGSIAQRAFDDAIFYKKDGTATVTADRTVRFGDGAIERSQIRLKYPRTVDRFTSRKPPPPKDKREPRDASRSFVGARILNTKLVPFSGAPGGTMRLEMSLSFDLYNRRRARDRRGAGVDAERRAP